MRSASPPTSHGRLAEVDALRGIAAMAVVLFHLTTQFSVIYPAVPPPPWQFEHGHYGVNLFFIISGFVIFMTLDRARRAMDFVVSRFSRLYPAYWVSIALTFTITHWLGLPGKLADPSNALLNGLMFHRLFGVPHVDGVYWTLEVELFFYCWMLLLYSVRMLDKVFLVALGLLALRWIYFILQQVWGIDLPWIVFRLLILAYLPWFVLGMACYALRHGGRTQATTWQIHLAVAAALLTLLVVDSPLHAGLGVAFFMLVKLASSQRLPWLNWRPLVWLGSISYPLYLLHENIAWALMLQGLQRGLSRGICIVLALAMVLVLAEVVSRWVERPAMTAIREAYRRRVSRSLLA